MMRRVFFLLLAALLLPSLARANGSMGTWLINDVGSQVRIVESQAFSSGGSDFECVRFTNVGQQPIKTVVFRFTYISGERKVAGFDTLTRRGNFAPGIEDGIPHQPPGTTRHAQTFFFSRYPGCQGYNVPPGGIAILAVNVDRVEFADGTVWMNPKTTRASATPTSAPPTPAQTSPQPTP